MKMLIIIIQKRNKNMIKKPDQVALVCLIPEDITQQLLNIVCRQSSRHICEKVGRRLGAPLIIFSISDSILLFSFCNSSIILNRPTYSLPINSFHRL